MNNLTEEQIKKILVDISNKWTNTDFSVVGSLFDLEGEQAKAISSALIGKCATPTFSGEKKEKPFPISKCCNASVILQATPTAQKFYVCQACGKNCDLAEWNKEPKPKDRIVGILKQDYSGQHKELRDKINELAEEYGKLINFINNRKEY